MYFIDFNMNKGLTEPSSKGGEKLTCKSDWMVELHVTEAKFLSLLDPKYLGLKICENWL